MISNFACFQTIFDVFVPTFHISNTSKHLSAKYLALLIAIHCKTVLYTQCSVQLQVPHCPRCSGRNTEYSLLLLH